MFGQSREDKEVKEMLKKAISGLESEKSSLQSEKDNLKVKVRSLEDKVNTYETNKALEIERIKSEHSTALNNLEHQKDSKINDLETKLSNIRNEIELQYNKELAEHQNRIAAVNTEILSAKEELNALKSKTQKESVEKIQEMQLAYEKLELKYKHDITSKQKEIDSLNAEIKNRDEFYDRYKKATTEFTEQLQKQVLDMQEERNLLLKTLRTQAGVNDAAE